MSDARARELLRRWLASGADDEGRAWLAARLRAGERAAVELAAELGHPLARELFPGARWHDPERWVLTLRRWLTAVMKRGPEVRARVLLALARRSWALAAGAPELARLGEPARPIVAGCEAALEAARAWAVKPGVSRSHAAFAAASRLLADAHELQGDLAEEAALGRSPREQLEAVRWLARRAQPVIAAAAASSTSREGRSLPWLPGFGSTHVGARSWAEPAVAIDRMKGLLPGDDVLAVRDAVRAELLPWALGTSDPLAASAAAPGDGEVPLGRASAPPATPPARRPPRRGAGQTPAGAELRARLERGELTPLRLLLAAWLGDEAAERALRWPRPRADRPRCLATADREAQLRLDLARVRAALELDELAARAPQVLALQAAERCLLRSPSKPPRAALTALARLSPAAALQLAELSPRARPGFAPGQPGRQSLLACCALALALRRPLRTLLGLRRPPRSTPATLGLEARKLIARLSPQLEPDELSNYARESGLALPIVRRELVPWLLGQGDPLADRHGRGAFPGGPF